MIYLQDKREDKKKKESKQDWATDLCLSQVDF